MEKTLWRKDGSALVADIPSSGGTYTNEVLAFPVRAGEALRRGSYEGDFVADARAARSEGALYAQDTFVPAEYAEELRALLAREGYAGAAVNRALLLLPGFKWQEAGSIEAGEEGDTFSHSYSFGHVNAA